MLAMTACNTMTSAQRAERDALVAQAVNNALAKRNYVIDIDMMYPTGAPARRLTNDYILKVEGDMMTSYLPYFGRAWDLPYGGGHGLNFEADIQESDVFRETDGSYTVRLLIRTDEDTHVYTFQIFPNGSTSLLVQSKNREPINYSGNTMAMNVLAGFTIPNAVGPAYMTAVWHFNGTYSGVPISSITASGVATF